MSLKSFDVCLLRPREVAEYERHGMLPGCKTGMKHHHTHISLHEADRREADGHGRYLDLAKRYMAAETAKVWAPAGPVQMRSLQLVMGCVRGRAGQFSTKVPALGARGRNTSVRDTNQRLAPVVASVEAQA